MGEAGLISQISELSHIRPIIMLASHEDALQERGSGCALLPARFSNTNNERD